MPLPKHVFISYSRRDQEFAVKLQEDLERANIHCWMDTSLAPGTPNWQIAIRQAIDEAFATVAIISQNVLGSEYIQGELGITRGKGLPILPVWIEGEDWYLSAPMELHAIQFTDMRAGKYDASLPELADELRKIMARSPSHAILEPSELHNLSGEHIAVELPQAIVGFRYGAYDTFNALTGDLFKHYLMSDVPPYSYGSKWMLTSQEEFGLRILALPWEWLLLEPQLRHQPLRQFYPNWGNEPLRTYGIEPGSRWVMIQGVPQRVFGVAGQHDWDMKHMKWMYDLLYHTHRDGEWRRPDTIPIKGMKYRIVMIERVQLGLTTRHHENQAFWYQG